MSGNVTTYKDLDSLVKYLRSLDKKYILLFAYNGTGKTRLSMEFKEAGKQFDENGNVKERDTLYFNAFTEDLFYWDNDLKNNDLRALKFNKDSKFFNGFKDLVMDDKIRPLLHRYSNFNFLINYEDGSIKFIREEIINGTLQNVENIKVSRGEENIFIWCLFLAIVELAIEKQESYNWVKYIYIDDPVSSLDDNNTIVIANHLSNILKNHKWEIKTIISTHHALFFNVLCNEFKKSEKLFLRKNNNGYDLKDTNDSPFFYHVALIQELQKAIDTGNLYTYHFNILRTILEKAANFHGFEGFSDCIEIDNDDEYKTLRTRMINVLNHGSYSLFEPIEMVEENKKYFKQIFKNFMKNYKFNEDLFDESNNTEIT